MSSGSHNTHARLAPSASERWTTCTASVAYMEENKDRLPKDTGSIYATEGTQAHDYAADLIDGLADIDEIPEDFRPHLELYVNHCLQLQESGDETFCEIQVPLFYSPEQKGTCDFAIIRTGHEPRVVIRDLKYGAGVKVHAQENTQLAIYAMSFIAAKEAEGVVFSPDTIVDLGIVQPRYQGEEVIDTWEIPLHDFRGFCGEIADRAVEIQTGENLKFAPSTEACRWCPAKAFCQARAAELVSPLSDDPQLALDFLAALPDLSKEEKKAEASERMDTRFGKAAADVDLSAVLDDETQVALFKNMKNIVAWLGDVEESLSTRLLAGESIEGVKLVRGRAGNRAWADEEAADKLLAGKLKADERYTKKLISPTQAEAALKGHELSSRFQNRLKELVTRSEGKLTIALDSDKRPAETPPLHALESLPMEGPED